MDFDPNHHEEPAEHPVTVEESFSDEDDMEDVVAENPAEYYHRHAAGHHIRAHHLMEEGPDGERDEDYEPHEEEYHESDDDDVPALVHPDELSEDDLPEQHAPGYPDGNQGPHVFRGWQRLGNRANAQHLIHAVFGLNMASSNEEMMEHLKMTGNLKSNRMIAAFEACPRGEFVPREYEDEAYIDSPLRLEEHSFNVSAPHMHAMSLEAMDIQPGHRVLDIGCGCGVVSAICAFLVGTSGSVVGIDILENAVELSKDNLGRLKTGNPEYAQHACPCHFEEHNIFMPHASLGTFDRIYAGARCTEDLLPSLIRLLSPGSGTMVVPVESELRLISRLQSGRIISKVLSQVRFGELVVPPASRIVLETMKVERQIRTSVQLPASTLAQDMVEASASSLSRGTSSSSSRSAYVLSTSPEASASSCSCYSTMIANAKSRVPSRSAGQLQAPLEDPLHQEHLGPCDCLITGDGWSLPAHKALLKARSEHFRAKFDSGMRDADTDELLVPENFSKESMEMFLHYVYHDELRPGAAVEGLASLVHVAVFFGTQRLVVMCEVEMSKELQRQTDDNIADLAPQLLMLADEAGLTNLRNAALDYITHNYAAVCNTAAFHDLSREQMALVAQTAASLYMRAITSLQEVSGAR